MGSTLVRASKDPDSLYILWSSITDSPVWVFTTREEALAYYTEWARYQHPYFGDDGHWHVPDEVPEHARLGMGSPEAILERTDTRGSSSFLRYLGWGDSEVNVYGGTPDPPEGIHWVLPRDRFQDYAQALLAEDDGAAHALLIARPYED